MAPMSRSSRPPVRSLAITLGALAASAGCTGAAEAALDRATLDRAKGATVLVDTGDAYGSAFCIDAADIFVTNQHVIEGTPQANLKIVLNAGTDAQRIVPARVLRTDPDEDLALLQAVATPPLPP